MNVPNFEIHARPDAICAQRLVLALSPRGASYQWKICQSRERLVLRHPDGTTESCEDPLMMIELIESCYTDQPLHPRDGERLALHRRLMQATLDADRRLADVLTAKGIGDLDLALHFLFRGLESIEAGIEAPPRVARQPLSNLDVMIAPLLWRIVLLDRRASTYILASLPRLGLRAEWLLKQMEVTELLDQQAADSFIAEIGQLSVAMQADGDRDWAAALGGIGSSLTQPELSLVPPSPDQISRVRTLRGLASTSSASVANSAEDRPSPPLAQIYAARHKPARLPTSR